MECCVMCRLSGPQVTHLRGKTGENTMGEQGYKTRQFARARKTLMSSSHPCGSDEPLGLHPSIPGRPAVIEEPEKQRWTRRDSNPWPSRCKRDDLPLIYEPPKDVAY